MISSLLCIACLFYIVLYLYLLLSVLLFRAPSVVDVDVVLAFRQSLSCCVLNITPSSQAPAKSSTVFISF
jgi:hypothetical protein